MDQTQTGTYKNGNHFYSRTPETREDTFIETDINDTSLFVVKLSSTMPTDCC